MYLESMVMDASVDHHWFQHVQYHAVPNGLQGGKAGIGQQHLSLLLQFVGQFPQ